MRQSTQMEEDPRFPELFLLVLGLRNFGFIFAVARERRHTEQGEACV